MQDIITSVINQYDLSGRYLDIKGINQINNYFDTGLKRLMIAKLINKEATNLIKEASELLFIEQPELLRPCGNAFIGNAYTTRRYAACIRDIEYYLRYSAYSIIAGNNSILDERVLDGLKETYNSLLVPIGPTIRVIQLLKEIIQKKFSTENIENAIIAEPFDYLAINLSDKNL
uniref:Allophycocyanin beta 18 subunit n=1 Tax=Porphyridium purpureum TaxID=35688 RepID=W0RZE2_PORPP|nr:allophycocyanin beta 18 subunit [Porphyridium purpureum]6KGX_WH Chain WH, Allophycocyanin beta 18 subunit [Porphyridium purpureum]6KGX_yH Chain yH, Allophycocyanin beta 18 subunit [Porphyridium purpureum]7EZX_WP Chain WP, Allophycocyanin beta 18 subunit [Porphyridium purpureum]7EZX_yP Chain yP, Allophycocyanin beta 18 subunit [Porphyridium purpureum]7Y4L_W3 Chain W3, Allophycocyanin beta 18 subunit [Porphyridium purpureum]7Y4L_y3 Chain y3, Allophycocyanin beta 18 subunit [Porphyridium purp